MANRPVFSVSLDARLFCRNNIEFQWFGGLEYYGGWEHSNMLPRATYKKHTRNYNMLVRAIRAQWTQMAVPSRL